MKLLDLLLIRRAKHWASKKLHFVTKLLSKEGAQAGRLQTHSLPGKEGKGRKKASDLGLISCHLDL